MNSETNPWMITLWFAAIAALGGGFAATSANADPLAGGYSPAWAALGPALVVTGGVLAAAGLAAGAVLWQMRRVS